jgi:Flp pilus assembly protein CpaB
LYKYSFLYAAVAFIVLLSYTEVSTLTQYAIAQEQSSNQTQIIVAQTPEEKDNLERFDKLDFEAWNNRNWTLFREIHAPDVLVVDFNGNTTRGIEQHVQWAMAAISAAPDSRILAHPIKIAAGNWTAATGILPGNVTMVTVAHWKDGRIAEEYLFMQNPTVMNQAESG